MVLRRGLSLLLGCMLGVGLLSAANLPVHNTGVNASDVLQPIGAGTSFWTLFSEPLGASEAIGSTPFRYFNGAYFADSSVSGWVSPGSDGNAGVGGNYVYQMSVDLTGFNLATVVISGGFGTDNDGDISLNGGLPVATTGNADFLSGPTPFTFNSGFVSGVNFIRVRVDNNGDPTAFRVEFSTATATPGVAAGVPEPGTWGLMSLGAIALAFVRRRSR